MIRSSRVTHLTGGPISCTAEKPHQPNLAGWCWWLVGTHTHTNTATPRGLVVNFIYRFYLAERDWDDRRTIGLFVKLWGKVVCTLTKPPFQCPEPEVNFLANVRLLAVFGFGPDRSVAQGKAGQGRQKGWFTRSVGEMNYMQIMFKFQLTLSNLW